MSKTHPLFCTALRESLASGYRWDDFKKDALASLTVSLVALPLAMALAIAVGVPPQHGIYTAIIAGILTPLLGGSRMQVSGPTAAFVVVVAPIVAEHGLRGMIIAQVMAGLILLLLAKIKLGRFIHFVPYPVTTGFTAGIAVVIGVLSLNDLLGIGLQSTESFFVSKCAELAMHLSSAQPSEMLIGLVSLAVMLGGKRLSRRVPSIILGVFAGTVVGLAFQYAGVEYASIGNRFDYVAGGVIGHGIPPIPPQWYDFGGWPTYDEIRELMMPAVVIAALAALESLLSASVADGLSRTRHHPNSELAAIGVANIACGMFSGIPATGAIARTTTNIKSEARTPLASAMHGVWILIYVLALAPVMSYVPMAALAALLLVVAYNMSHYRQFWRIVTIAPRHDVLVLLVSFALTVLIDMVAGVLVGIMLAALLFIQKIAAATEIEVESVEQNLKHAALPPNAIVYHIHGPLFFATVERAFDRTAFLRNRIDTIILNMEHVPLIDMTGLVAIKQLLDSDALGGKRIIVCAKPDIAQRITHKLSGEVKTLPMLCHSVDEAIAAITA